jgi:hypothetical protein
MKAGVLKLLFWVIALSSVQAQNNDFKQSNTFAWTTYALLGPVRTVRTETATIFEHNGRFVESPRTLSMTIAFNEDINRTEVCFHDSKGVLTRRITTKYEGSRDVEYINYDGVGNMWLRTVIDYDQKGQTTGGATYNGDGSLRSRSVVKRNGKGQVVEESTFDAKGILLEQFVTNYNDEGELSSIERTFYGADGSLRRKELVNAKTKQSETVNYNRNGTLAGSTVRVDHTIREYDKEGAFTKSVQVGDVGHLLDEFAYRPDGTTARTVEIPDEIDSHGNWVKQTKWVSDASGRRPVSVTYRAITYY